jgi:uncharacterized membrane protein
MPETMDEYVSQRVAAGQRTQARWVLFWAIAVIAVWVGLILAAPLARANGLEGFAAPIYRFFSYICHQIPDRTFDLLSHPMGVCSRCFGVYLGVLLGMATYPFWRNLDEIEPMPRIWLFLALLPIGIDWSLTVLGIWENTFTSRFLTGSILGVACAVFIVPALVEIARNYSGKPAK